MGKLGLATSVSSGDISNHPRCGSFASLDLDGAWAGYSAKADMWRMEKVGVGEHGKRRVPAICIGHSA